MTWRRSIMANSDWARETPQKEEIKWFYFKPVLGDFPKPNWEFSGDGVRWYEVPDWTPICRRDLKVLWRKPYTSKEN